MQEDTTGRFATLETKMVHVEKQIEAHSAEDTRRFDKLEAMVEKVSLRVAMIVGGITVVGVVVQLLAHGGH